MGEELANSISHGIGFVSALIASPVLVLGALRHGASAVVGAAVFAATMSLLYLTSTIYHALPENRAKRVFQILDHGAIYLLIAGTYTPFTLVTLRGPWGWSLFGTVWGLAIIGIVKELAVGRERVPSVPLYVAMGWLGVIAAVPLFNQLPAEGLFWLVAGGLMYTVGIIFYANDERWRHAHGVWHLFVLGGTACHYYTVLEFVA